MEPLNVWDYEAARRGAARARRARVLRRRRRRRADAARQRRGVSAAGAPPADARRRRAVQRRRRPCSGRRSRCRCSSRRSRSSASRIPTERSATARAATRPGTIMCLSTLATSTPAEVAAVGGPCWFQLYVFRDEGVTRELVAQARDSGFRALVLTIDAPVRGNRERDARTAFAIPPDITVASLGRGGSRRSRCSTMISPSLTWHDLERIAARPACRSLVKGVLTAEDALLACEHGAAGIVVSNHGGRQLDGVSATIDALPEVVAAVDGRIEVLRRRRHPPRHRRREGARPRRARRAGRPRAALGACRRRRGGRPPRARDPAVPRS